MGTLTDMRVVSNADFTREDVIAWNQVAARVWARNLQTMPTLRPHPTLFVTSLRSDRLDAVLMQVYSNIRDVYRSWLDEREDGVCKAVESNSGV